MGMERRIRVSVLSGSGSGITGWRAALRTDGRTIGALGACYAVVMDISHQDAERLAYLIGGAVNTIEVLDRHDISPAEITALVPVITSRLGSATREELVLAGITVGMGLTNGD